MRHVPVVLIRTRSLESTAFGRGGDGGAVTDFPAVGRFPSGVDAVVVVFVPSVDAGDGSGMRNDAFHLLVVEDLDSAADGDGVVVVSGVVCHLCAGEETLVDQHRSHAVLVHVDDQSLVGDPE